MDNNPVTPPVAPTDVPPATPPAPPAAPAPPPPVIPATPQFSDGGVSPKKGFFDGITLTDVGMIALASFSFFMIIYYYRSKIAYLKKEKPTVQKDIDELKANVQAALGADYKTF